jgi:hypothetical protein
MKAQAEDAEVTEVRAIDKDLHPGVEADMGEGDEWPPIRAAILDWEILGVPLPVPISE